MGEAGYTIAELLVAAFIALVVLGVVFSAVRFQGRGAALQAGVADAQLTTGGTVELLTQDLRMAGYGMLGVAPEANVPPLSVAQNAGVTTLTLRGNYSNVVSGLALAVPAGATSLTVTTPASGAFQVGNLALIDSGLNSEVKTISSVSSAGGNVSLGLTGPLLHAYPIGPEITQIEVVTYTYDGVLLRRNGQVLADNASTFQLQYVDQSGTLTSAVGDNVRSVVVNVVAQQPTKLADNPTAQSSASIEANLRNLAFRFTLS